MSFATDFRDFIVRGNVVDLAVGVVIGAAFNGVVTAFTKDILTAFIGIPGKVSLGDVSFAINGSKFLLGDFINTLISFVLTALVVYAFVVKPMNYLNSRRKVETPPAEETTIACPYCLSKIPRAATRCAFCTSELAAASSDGPVAVTSTASQQGERRRGVNG